MRGNRQSVNKNLKDCGHILQHAKRNDTQFNRETKFLLLIGRKGWNNI